MARILVTGGLGFIGSNLVPELKKRGHEVWVCDLGQSGNPNYVRCDVREYRQLERVFETHVFDYVYHLAAEYGRWNGEDYYENLWLTNVVGTKNIIRLQEKLKFKMIFFSSAEVYGDYEGVMSEYRMDTVPIKQMNDYAMTKWVGELQCLNSASMFDTETVRVRPVNCFSGDTDVLTPTGIKNIKEFKIGDSVYTLNPQTLEVEVDTVVDTISSQSNEIVNIKGKAVDWRVTTDHIMYLSSNGLNNGIRKKPQLIKAIDLIGKSQRDLAKHCPMNGGENFESMDMWRWVDNEHLVCLQPHSNGKSGISKLRFKKRHGKIQYYDARKRDIPDIEEMIRIYGCKVYVKDYLWTCHFQPIKIPISPFLRVLAWYITEGHVQHGRYAQVNICQYGEYRDEIIEAIKGMGYEVSIGRKFISFSSRVFRNFIDEFGLNGSENKCIPNFIFGLSLSLRLEFLETLMKGDGDKHGNRYSTQSKKLAEDFVHLAFTCGREVLLRHYDEVPSMYRVILRVKGKHRSIKRHNVSLEKVNNERVYCITAQKTHIIYAGRNGFLGWVGQCYGIGERYNPYRGVIPAFIYKALKGEPYTVYLGHRRIFDYVEDTCRTFANIVGNFKAGEAYNIGGREEWEVDIKQVSDIILKLLGKDNRLVKYVEAEPFTTKVKHMDFSKARRDLRHDPKITLEEGLSKTIEWMRSVYGV